MMPVRILVVAVMWLVALVTVFAVYVELDAFADLIPGKLGPLPVSSLWFGALGGLLISLQGIFTHNHGWHRSYDYWHYLRPVLGAVMGTLGCLIFSVLNDAATTSRPTTNSVFYAVIAFVLGYREASFRQLVTRLIDTIVLPPDAAPPNTTAPPATPAAATATPPAAAADEPTAAADQPTAAGGGAAAAGTAAGAK